MSNFTSRSILAATFLLISLGALAQPGSYPSGFKATTTDATHIKLEWTAAGSPAATGYLIQGRISPATFPGVTNGTPVTDDTDWADNLTAVNVGAVTSYDIVVLANKTYEFRIIPYRTTPTNPAFKTDAGGPPTIPGYTIKPGNHPSGFAATTTDATHIHLSWTESATTPLADKYLIVARVNPDGTFPTVTDGTPVTDDTDWTDDVAAFNVTAGANSYDFTVLAGKDYEFKLYPYKGTTGPIFRTDATVPTAAATTRTPGAYPTSFAASTTDATHIHLSWTESATTPLPDQYLIVARVTPGGTFAAVASGTPVGDDTDWTNDNAAFSVPAGTNTYDFTVVADKAYEFKIYPYTTGGLTPPYFKTDGTVPSASASTIKPTIALGGVPVSSITHNSATISYTISDLGGSPVSERGVVWGTTAGTYPNTVADPGTTPTTGGYTTAISSLPAGTQIFYRAYAKNDAGSKQTAEGSFFTLAAPPGNPVGTITATALTGTSIRIDFPSLATTGGGNLKGYVILRVQANTAPASPTNGVAPSAQTNYRIVITDINAPSFTDNTVLGNKQYYYAVVPYNSNSSDDPATFNYNTTGGLKTATATTPAAASDIVYNSNNGTYGNQTATFNYTATTSNAPSFPTSNRPMTFSGADGTLSIGRFTIRDSGGANDDGKPTKVTSISIHIDNFANVNAIGLFEDKASPTADVLYTGTDKYDITTGDLTFTLPAGSPITVAQDGSVNIVFRVWMNRIVTDNQRMTVSITGVETVQDGTSSGFAAADAGGATTTNAENLINVVAGRLRLFVDPLTPSPTSSGQIFNLKAQAIAHNNYPSVDLDYNDNVSIEGDNGQLAGQTLTGRTMINGEYNGWTGMSFSSAGTYPLTVTADANNLNDATTLTITVGSQGVDITPGDQSMCYGAAYQTVPTIKIKELDATGFSTGTNKTFSLVLPSGFKFNTNITSGVTIANSPADLTTTGAYQYQGDNVVLCTFTINGTSKLDEIRISGLQVTATYPNPFLASYSGQIERLAGSMVIAGDGIGEGKNHGTLEAHIGASAPTNLGFTVTKASSTDVTPDPAETRFSRSTTSVKLNGTSDGLPNSGTFTCATAAAISKLAGNDWRFNPSAVDAGKYTVTYTVNSGGCDYAFSKEFTVYESQIDGLDPSYCTNSDPSGPLTVSQDVIDDITRTPTGTWTFLKLQYWNQGGGGLTDMPLTGGQYIFDPKAPQYQLSYQAYGGAYLYWVATDGAGHTFGPIYTFVPVKTAVTPSIDISNLPADLSFCKDDAPVELKGVPAYSQDQSADNFTAQTSQGNSVAFTGSSPRVWIFKPADVNNVNLGSTTTVDITYTYTDPATACTATSPIVTLKVHARPGNVPSGDIISGVNAQFKQEVCEGVLPSPIGAQPITGTTYKWYADQALTTQAGLPGNSFTPPTSTTTAGETDFYVTRTIDGCESNRGSSSAVVPQKVTLKVNATPGAPVSDINRDYCAGTDPVPSQLQIAVSSTTVIKWYSPGTAGTASPLLSNVDSPTLTQIETALGVNKNVPGFYKFDVTQTASGCEGILNPTHVSVEIKPLPKLVLTADADPMSVCTSDAPVIFKATDDGNPAVATRGTGTWSGLTVDPDVNAGTAKLTPGGAIPGDYPLQFTFTNTATQCQSSETINVRVLPTIRPKLHPLDSCEQIRARLENLSDIYRGNLDPGYNVSISTVQWNFGDGTGLPPGAAGASVNDGRTTGTYFYPLHIYNNTGTVLLQCTMATSEGCTAFVQKSLQINPKPNVNFTWKNACMNTISSTEFNAVTVPPLPIQEYIWDYATTHTLAVTNPTETGATPIIHYATTGRDSVRLTVITNAQCRGTVHHPVFIVPSYPAIGDDNAYSEDFNNGAHGWVAGGDSSSWAVGKPTGLIIKTEGANNQAWDTNPAGGSKTKEKSWVLSPCFDFTGADKPIISFDIWSDTPFRNDGAVLQYNTDGDLLNNASWKVLGVSGLGSNWYDASGISSRPGSQASGDVGWTGEYGRWKHAAYKLDELRGKSNVIFRLAFASDNPREDNDGFAFDNIFIGERTRTVLLENFTNSSAAANTKVHNTIFRNFGQNNTSEITKVEYHTAFPGTDPINALNTAINSSRAAFYGLSSPGAFAIDGTVADATDLNQIYEDRVLTPAPFKIEINQVKDGEDVRISTKITNMTNLTIPTTKANVFTVLIEKRITEQSLLGSNGDPEFTYVARKMLPNAAGVPLGQEIGPNTTVILPEIMWTDLSLLDPANGAIAIFIQNTQGDNKNVFQSAIVDATVVPDITTGTELEMAEGIRLYPNPVNGADVTIVLPAQAKQDLPVSLMDAQGRHILTTSIPKGNSKHALATADLVNGFYIAEIKTDQGRFVRKKFMVMR